MSRSAGRRAALVACALLLLAVVPGLARGDGVIQLVPNTAILLDQSSSTTSGNGGNTSSTSTMTNIFSPPTYADYKRTGTEPVVTVDRYPYTAPDGTKSYSDTTYIDSTEGFGYPRYDFFFKSDNRGQTFRLPHNDPTTGGRALAQGQGGGDGYQAVGELSHKVFFVDLAADHVTMNISNDRGDTFTSSDIANGMTFAADDRQWVATDEGLTGKDPTSSAGNYSCLTATPSTCGNVYVNFNNLLELTVAPTIVLQRSTNDGVSFADSPCNPATAAADNPNPGATGPAADDKGTRCPDPVDPQLVVAGPVVVDKSSGVHAHRLYIPFVRCTPSDAVHGLVSCGLPDHLYIAYSDDGGATWLRHPLCSGTPQAGACLPPDGNPANIFVQMTIDDAGNLYYTWAQQPAAGGETDIYYSFSTDGGTTWSPGIDLTPEQGDSAVWPWMVAGDPGQVDLAYYKANCGVSPPQADGCVWNVYFAQSQNALNTGANFKSVQVSDHPNHIGPICLSGLGCNSGRTLGDFFTLDYDHLGAANITFADDNNGQNRTFIKFTRQLSGNSVFKNTPINLVQSWPIHDHTVFDPTGDVVTPTSFPGAVPSCQSMDIVNASSSRNGDLLTVSLTLGAPPSQVAAATCSSSGAALTDGGFWGAEWWASGTPNDNFYLAYIDEPGIPAHFEAGRLNRASFPSLTGNEPRFVENATGSACVPVASPPASLPSECTISMTASLSGLGIKSGAGLYSLTGLSLYVTGNTGTIPFTNVDEGYTSLGDSTAAIDYNGTGTTSP